MKTSLPDPTPTIKDNISIAAILSSLSDSYIILIDKDGVVLFLNKPELEYVFLDFPIGVGVSLFEFIHNAKHETIKQLIQNSFYTGRSFRTNVEKIEHGVKKHFDIRYSPILNEFAVVTNVLIEARDVSGERIFVNKIGRITNDHYRLIENANAIIIGTDSRGYITEWNAMSEKVFGYSKQEVFATSFTRLLNEKENQTAFPTLLKSIVENGHLSNHELTAQTKSAKDLCLLINGTPRKNSAGNVDGILFVGQDITELIAYRRSLEDMVKERTKKLKRSNLKIIKQRDSIEQERKRSEQLLLNILPEFVATELKEQGYVTPRHFSQATILFADLVGFTSLCEGLSPEQIVHELNYIFVGFDMILDKNGLEKIKTIGDGYMAAGGIPITNQTHASDAVRSGLEMIGYVDRINKENIKSNKPPWQLRVGIHTGELIAGVIGRDKFTYDVWGATVNIASRMESAGVPGKVNISSNTFDLVKDNFKCIKRESLEIKYNGKMQMFFAQGVKG